MLRGVLLHKDPRLYASSQNIAVLRVFTMQLSKTWLLVVGDSQISASCSLVRVDGPGNHS